jgi:hypothetical protein
MSREERLVAIENLIIEVEAHGHGDVRITIQDGLITGARAEKSILFSKDLTNSLQFVTIKSIR